MLYKTIRRNDFQHVKKESGNIYYKSTRKSNWLLPYTKLIHFKGTQRMRTMTVSKFYTSKQMCTLLAISQTTLWRYRELNLIPTSIKLGGKRKWSREEVDRFIKNQFDD